MLDVMHDLAGRFDGENEDEVYDHFVRHYGLEFEGSRSARCIFGLLSAEEKRVIDEHVEVQNAYLADVRDTDYGPVVVRRDGSEEPIAPGSWIVNCTGVLLKEEPEPELACSEYGTILNLTPGASFAFLSSFGGYFMAHLWFRGLLGEVPVALLDHRRLLRANPKAYLLASAVQITYNTMLMQKHLPADVMTRCHLTFDRWYPVHRRLWTFGKLRMRRAFILRRMGETLEALDGMYGVARPVPPRAPMADTKVRLEPARIELAGGQ